MAAIWLCIFLTTFKTTLLLIAWADLLHKFRSGSYDHMSEPMTIGKGHCETVLCSINKKLAQVDEANDITPSDVTPISEMEIASTIMNMFPNTDFWRLTILRMCF